MGLRSERHQYVTSLKRTILHYCFFESLFTPFKAKQLRVSLKYMATYNGYYVGEDIYATANQTFVPGLWLPDGTMHPSPPPGCGNARGFTFTVSNTSNCS